MKKTVLLLTALLCAALFLLSACETEQLQSTQQSSAPEESQSAQESSCKILSISDSSVTALIYGKGLASFALPEKLSLESGLGDELKPGMTANISYTDIAETYPLQVNVQSAQATAYDDGLISMYLDILEELLTEVDPNLSDENEEYLGFDFSGLDNLTQEEKDSIGTFFALQHSRSPLFGTLDELGEQGYIDMENLYWKEGTAINLKVEQSSEEEFSLDCEKWKSGIGAVGYTLNCQKLDGVWTASETGAMWMS